MKYLNNIVEQDHRFIKKVTDPMLDFKAFHSATATLVGIEVAQMILKKPFQSNHISPSTHVRTYSTPPKQRYLISR